ncbi:MAG: DUF2029 domain-containing protein [Anaerolineae bacterium]|nr:DUF2029 domain-containing protein [Anaerolineae bacterium]
MTTQLKSWLSIALLVLLSVILCGLVITAIDGTDVGKTDLKAYWSASRLVWEGRNPCAPETMLSMQQQHVDPQLQASLMAWNPPSLWVFMLPLTWLPFEIARFVWLLANIGMTYATCILLLRIFVPGSSIRTQAIFIALAILFVPTLTVIQKGQVTLLVLLGLVGAVHLIKHDRWFWAGAFLCLTSVKPHLVTLTVPYLLAYAIMRKEWRFVWGLLSTSVFCMLTLFALRPEWIQDYSAYFSNPPSNWLTPTLGGLLQQVGVSGWPQYAGLTLLVLLPRFLGRSSRRSLESTVSLLTLITIPTTFFGWSFDQVMLLIPMAEIFSWILASGHPILVRIGASFASISVIVVSYVLRSVTHNDIHFIWIPILWVGIYALMDPHRNRTRSPIARSGNGTPMSYTSGL